MAIRDAVGFAWTLSRAFKLLSGSEKGMWEIGGVGYGDYYWGLDRDYYRDPVPHSLLSPRQTILSLGCPQFKTGNPTYSLHCSSFVWLTNVMVRIL